jgi:hypothetical protein
VLVGRVVRIANGVDVHALEQLNVVQRLPRRPGGRPRL